MIQLTQPSMAMLLKLPHGEQGVSEDFKFFSPGQTEWDTEPLTLLQLLLDHTLALLSITETHQIAPLETASLDFSAS